MGSHVMSLRLKSTKGKAKENCLLGKVLFIASRRCRAFEYVAWGTRFGSGSPPVSLNAFIHTNTRSTHVSTSIFFTFIKLTFSFVCVLLCSCAVLALLCVSRLYLLRHPVEFTTNTTTDGWQLSHCTTTYSR